VIKLGQALFVYGTRQQPDVTMRLLYGPMPIFMNTLVVGADKTPILECAHSVNFLSIDDGPLIDQLKIPQRSKMTRFDVAKHQFNPL
jgi:hypothetical protein